MLLSTGPKLTPIQPVISTTGIAFPSRDEIVNFKAAFQICARDFHFINSTVLEYDGTPTSAAAIVLCMLESGQAVEYPQRWLDDSPIEVNLRQLSDQSPRNPRQTTTLSNPVLKTSGDLHVEAKTDCDESFSVHSSMAQNEAGFPWKEHGKVKQGEHQYSEGVDLLTDDEIGSPSQSVSKAQANALDAILNPSQHFERLEKLERETAFLCHMHDFPRYIGAFQAQLHEYGEFSEYRDAFVNIRSALRRQKLRGICGREFNILIESQSRLDIALARTITEDDLDYLSNECFYIDNDLLNQASRNLMENFDTFTDSLLKKLTGFDKSKDADWAFDLPDDRHKRISKLQFIWNVLALGLISFSGSHVCRFDQTVWSLSMKEFDVGYGYKFALRDLACMDELIGGPAWVLVRASENTKVPRLQVSLTLKQFAELWGPAWFINLDIDGSNPATLVRTERGYIVPLPNANSKKLEINRSKEIPCHWTKSLQSVDASVFLRQPLPLSETSHLLIGSGQGLQVNTKCQAQIKVIEQQIARNLQTLGAASAHYIREGYELGFTGNQYVGVIGNMTWKRIPARTQKTVLVEYCTKPEAKLLPILKLRVGLEISACTGNAQRISLWDALRLAHASSRANHSTPPEDQNTVDTCSHQIGDKACIVSCWNVQVPSDGVDAVQDIESGIQGMSVQSDGGHVTHQLPGSMTNHEARKIIIRSILMLKETGVDHEQNLQAWWPFINIPTTYRITERRDSRHPYDWIRVVKDTRDTSTFAVVSQRCLEFGEKDLGRVCQFSPCNCRLMNDRDQLWRSSVTDRTILSTRFSIDFSTDQPEANLPSGQEVRLCQGTRLRLGEHLTLKVLETMEKPRAAIVERYERAFHRSFRKVLPSTESKYPRAFEQINDEVSTGHSFDIYVS